MIQLFNSASAPPKSPLLAVTRRATATFLKWTALLVMGALPFAGAHAATCGTSTTVTLFAGQTTNAGSVTVSNDESNLYVTYTTAGDWRLQQTHLHVADSLAGIPQTKTGNPKIGNFAYQTTHNPLVTTYTYTIPKAALSLDANKSVVIAAHAALVRVDGSGYVVASETGWAAGSAFTERGSWATYFQYKWQDCTVTPVVKTATQTAFAYSATAGTCFLALDLDNNNLGDFNRWGWTIGPLSEGVYSFDLYAGAGKCDITKGTRVGSVTVEYYAGTATVTYTMAGTNPTTGVAYNMVEAQLYVGSEVLPRDVNGEYTVAPGQYPDNAGELNSVATKTFTVTGLSGDVYVVAHATVAGFPL